MLHKLILRHVTGKADPVIRWGFAVAAIAVAIWLRFLLDEALPAGFPYLTFFPAVIMTAFFSGVGAGTVAAFVLGFVAWYFFVPPFGSFALDPHTLLALAFYAFIVLTEIFIIHVMSVAMRRQVAAEAASADLAQSRELMFRELQHRVSNNLSVIASLLALQRRRIRDADARRALDEASTRVALVSRINRMLHDPERQTVDFGAFLKAMAPEIVTANGVGARVQVTVEAVPLEIGPDRAVPLALIATELVANAVEHGFGEEGRGRIAVTLREVEGQAELAVADDGAGPGPEFDLLTTESLGLTIAQQFAGQIEGVLTIGPQARGTVARLIFPAVA